MGERADLIFIQEWAKDGSRNPFVEVNDAACESLGYTQKDMLTLSPFEIFEPQPGEDLLLLPEKLSQARSVFCSVSLITRTGNRIPGQMTAHRFHINRTPVILYMFRQILEQSEHKWAENVLKEYAQRLEEMVEARTRELKDIQEQLVRSEKLAVLGQLAGGVGHELRRPLSVINNAVYYLKAVLDDADDKVKGYLNLIAWEIQDAERIVSDLLDFSRAKPADRKEEALCRIVKAVLDKTPPPQGIKVIPLFPENLPRVKVDPGQISQVLINLIHNAYEAMPQGGQLTISALSEKESVCLRVADTGCGISGDNMTKIFEPLFTTKSRGIGLGLAISKNLVEANGGKIDVQSREGQGSAFTIIFSADGQL